MHHHEVFISVFKGVTTIRRWVQIEGGNTFTSEVAVNSHALEHMANAEVWAQAGDTRTGGLYEQVSDELAALAEWGGDAVK